MAHEYACSNCAFMVRSEDDDELVDFVQKHAETAHDMRVPADDVRAGWQSTDADD